MLFEDCTVLIWGGGEMGSGIAHRLFRSGFLVIIVEQPRPTAIRRAVCFSEAVYDGRKSVEGVIAERVRCPEETAAFLGRREAIPVLIDPTAALMGVVRHCVLVDSRMLKSPPRDRRDDAHLVIGVGPGFVAGENCHVVVETQRGNDLGRVIERGSAMENTGVPGEIDGYGRERVVRAPARGTFSALKPIGALVERGEVIAEVAGVVVKVEVAGLLRGIIRGGTEVEEGMKVADVDPRGEAIDPHRISDKARAVAGGVLEAILRYLP